MEEHFRQIIRATGDDLDREGLAETPRRAAAAFQYLRALDVDYVKIDGVYVREAFTEPNGKAYLKSMQPCTATSASRPSVKWSRPNRKPSC